MVPFDCARLAEKPLTARERRQHGLYLGQRQTRAGSDGCRREARTRHAGDFQQALLGWRQAFDLVLDHPANVVRDTEVARLDIGSRGPGAMTFEEHTAAGEIAQHVDDEQRVAAGAQVYEPREALIRV
jgi:hypothetical protein